MFVSLLLLQRGQVLVFAQVSGCLRRWGRGSGDPAPALTTTLPSGAFRVRVASLALPGGGGCGYLSLEAA